VASVQHRKRRAYVRDQITSSAVRQLSNMHTGKTIIILAIMVAWGGNSVAQEKWFRYCNARFGQCADIPRNYKSDPPPANGDGLIFRNGKGMVVVVSAMFNALDYSLTDAKNEIMKNLPKPTYQAEGDNWFVVSGISDGKIYYIKKYVTADYMSTLWIEYPEANKNLYDVTISRLSKSFTPAHN
jgi:hypothetical protein